MAFSGILTFYCAHLLIESKRKLDAKNFMDLAEKSLGKAGKLAVDLTLTLSQMGFVCAFIYFIVQNLSKILSINKDWLDIICFVVFSILCFIRRIELFASTMIFADVMIFVTLLIILINGCIKIHKGGGNLKYLPLMSNQWTEPLGFSVYAYEGIGVILPVESITANKK